MEETLKFQEYLEAWVPAPFSQAEYFDLNSSILEKKCYFINNMC